LLSFLPSDSAASPKSPNVIQASRLSLQNPMALNADFTSNVIQASRLSLQNPHGDQWGHRIPMPNALNLNHPRPKIRANGDKK
jgi:hypothetical protein